MEANKEAISITVDFYESIIAVIDRRDPKELRSMANRMEHILTAARQKQAEEKPAVLQKTEMPNLDKLKDGK